LKTYSAWKVAIILVLMCAAFAISSSAQTLTTIYDFCSQTGCADGGAPWGTLVQGSDGSFYGTTSNIGLPGYGTVYKLTASGTLTVLHTFTGGQDGERTVAGMIQASDGNFYGVTPEGGGVSGCGRVYRVTPSGTLTPLHEFAGSPSDGCQPFGPLVQASDGNFYGTTYYGGTSNNCDAFGCGMVFKVTTGRTETNLHNFCTQSGCPDGYNPQAGLVQGSDGNLYGETFYGGPNGFGTAFKITLSGTLTTLHNFDYTDGADPFGTLVQGRDGNFYGTTSAGGANGGGEIFKMTSSGTLTTLYSFCSQSFCRDGEQPRAGLLQASDGNFYGTTAGGGANVSGTIFAITPGGAFSSLYSFCSLGGTSCTDGSYPYAGLIQASDGKLYGVTSEGGGPNLGGTAFSLQVNEDTLTVTLAGDGTVTSTDGFINCPGMCSHIYQHDAQVTLNATAAGGWNFSDWSGACTGTGSCNVTMSQPQTVTANFSQLSYTLTVTATGNGSVTSADGFINCPGTCSHLYLSNTEVALTANPALGWSLNAWGGACSGNNPACNVTMTGPESVSATFTQDSYMLTVSISGSGSVASTDSFIHCPGTCSHTYLSLTPVTLNATPAQGWVFGGWSGPCLGTGSCSITMTQTFVVGAVFSEAEQFVPLSQPCRAVDTRPSQGGGGPIPGGTHQDFPISGEGNCATLPNAAVYSMNVTVVPATRSLGYLTIWPAGGPQPVVSTLNSVDGRVKANAAIVPAGTSGDVSVYVTDTTNVIVDVNGYFAPVSGSTLAFYPLPPCRVADTRYSTYPQGLGPPSLTGGQPRDFPILNATTTCNIPPTGVAAYSLNFTVVPHGTLGYLTVWPTGQDRPTVSTLNDVLGRVIANAAIVVAGSSGEISAYATNNTDLVIDIDGYFAPAGQGGLSLYAVAPCRVIDTRHVGNGQPFTGTLSPPVDVVNSQCGVSGLAQAYVFNATVIPVHSLGYLTLWPDGENQPVVSTLNAQDGSLTNNMAIVPAGTAGKVDAFANGLTQLILDISSYFAP
jgi:uncharacterized repeat protein (TIGR03803 family)